MWFSAEKLNTLDFFHLDYDSEMSLPHVNGIIYIMNQTSQMDWLMQRTFFS